MNKRRVRAGTATGKHQEEERAFVPVVVSGRKIAGSFWGKAWCDNLERYSDYMNRLPRGRTYLRKGAVVDLRILRGRLQALVLGTDLYEVRIDIALAVPEQWQAICRDCAGSIDSLVELLQGRLSEKVMERVCRQDTGLFPAPREIKMSCTCPDWATMCKHVAATLYGVGTRLDQMPELLFTLRGVDSAQLIAAAGSEVTLGKPATASERVIAAEDVAGIFGIEIEPPPAVSDRRAKEAAMPKNVREIGDPQVTVPRETKETKKSMPSSATIPTRSKKAK